MATHGIAELSFDELDFAGQARSINGSIRHMERAIRAHVRRASFEGRDIELVLNSRIDEVRRMLARLAQPAPESEQANN
jgi:hypothetical protein